MGFSAAKATSILTQNITEDTYVGLFTSGGAEPPSDTGYVRAKFGKVNTSEEAQVANDEIIFFNETLNSGYGQITEFGLFTAQSSGTAFFVGSLAAPITIGEGYIPIFRAKQLVIGLDKAVLTPYD